MQQVRSALALVVSAGLLATLTASAVGAQDLDGPQNDAETVVIDGHGWGHGRGMGQYGSLGYAVDLGWTSSEILDHYYGDTVAGTLDNDLITVRIDSANDEATIAGVDSGAIVLIDDQDTATHIGTGGAIRLTHTADGFVLADAPDCSGPFVDRPGTIDAEQLRISTASAQPSGGIAAVGDGSVVVGDWDADGDDDLGTVVDGVWNLWFDGPTTANTTPDRTFTFGDAGATYLSADWDGDGFDSPVAFLDGTWTSRVGYQPEAPTSVFVLGIDAGDVPVVGDWDGDGDTDAGIRRGDTWMVRTGDDGGGEDITFAYGRAADTPVVGDWNGDGISDPGFVRGNTLRSRIGLDGATTGLANQSLGTTSAAVLSGDWNGDDIAQPAWAEGGVADLTGSLSAIAPRLDPELELDETIHRCTSVGVQSFYRGELRAVANNGNQRTVNAVALESYLRAVVPLEMPASWAALGDGAGAAAVQVQAVSARSYSMAEDRTSYAQTCDTISCQVYGGRAVRRNGETFDNEHPMSDAALLATAGVVRMRDGDVARTEFSSSTGGWTAGGVFPAVEDLGDAVARNPNHDWTTTISVDAVEARYSGRSLTSIQITERNGLGRDGGRVEEVTITFGEETFTMTGNEFRRAFGLKSDWYTIDWVLVDGRVDCICPTEWPTDGLDEHFIEDEVDA
jgi:SpoIID/LytB domain protein